MYKKLLTSILKALSEKMMILMASSNPYDWPALEILSLRTDGKRSVMNLVQYCKTNIFIILKEIITFPGQSEGTAFTSSAPSREATQPFYWFASLPNRAQLLKKKRICSSKISSSRKTNRKSQKLSPFVKQLQKTCWCPDTS